MKTKLIVLFATAVFFFGGNIAIAQTIWKFKPRTRTISFTESGVTTIFKDSSVLLNTTSRIADPANCPTNMDFENGDFTGWECYTGAARNIGGVNTFVSLPTTPVSPVNGRHTIISSATTPAFDPYGNFPVLCPNGSNYSVKLGNTATTPSIPNGGGGYADKISYTFTIPPSQSDFSLIYYYAVVFQNPPHNSWEQPRFQAKVSVQGGTNVLSCANYDFTATSGLPGFTATTNSVLYKPWTPVTVNLKGYQGQTLILEFIRENCTLSGHFGYAYVDVVPNCNGITVPGADYCVGTNSVTLTAPPGYQTYNWYNQNYTSLLGTGQTLTLSPPPPNNTTLNIALFPFPGFGCDDTVTTTLTTRPLPVSSFTVDQTPVCQSANNFSFTSTSTISDASAMTYKWIFGDNTFSTSQNPTHSYAAPGTYNVRLITFNSAGCSDTSAPKALTVLPNPSATFIVTSSDNQCIVANNFTFQNTSPPYGVPVNYTWDFGDGTNSTQTPNTNHSYITGGSYWVKLTATQANNTSCFDTLRKLVVVQPQPTVSFSYYTGDNQCLKGNVFSFKNNSTSLGPLTYIWSFGDGTTSTLPEPTKTYTAVGNYAVKLVAFGAAGCKDSTTNTVYVNANPVAAFTITDTAQCLRNNNFTFTDNSNYGGTLTWDWNFGDGTTSTLQNPSKSYPTYANNYSVRLIATTDKGCKDTLTKKVYLFQHPQASFVVNTNVQQCQRGNQYSFTNNSSFPTALTYQWIFANTASNTQNNTTATASYNSVGNYPVKLVATTVEKGCTDTATQTMELYPNPGASFRINTQQQCLAGNNFVFDNVPTGTNYQYAWDFGDANNSTSSNPSHTYTNVTSFNVRLIVNNVVNTNLTCSDTTTKQVTVNPMPIGLITNKGNHFMCEGDSMKLFASGGQSYQWFKDGIVVNNAIYSTYSALKEGFYTLDAINQFGCRASSLDTAFITERKVSKPDFAWDTYCIFKTMQLTNSTVLGNANNASYVWDFGNGLPTSSLVNPQTVYNSAGSYKIKLTATSTFCPSQVTSKEKLVRIELPPAPVRYPTMNAVMNNTYTLNARTLGALFSWQPITDLTNPNTRTPFLIPTGERDYTVFITTPSGCETTDSLRVLIFKRSEVLVPKAFTPNHDGLNDVLYPILVGIKELKSFRVYNRWGNVVFQTSTASYGWDGMYKGILQPADTYTWVAEAIDDKGILIHNGGNTILIR